MLSVNCERNGDILYLILVPVESRRRICYVQLLLWRRHAGYLPYIQIKLINIRLKLKKKKGDSVKLLLKVILCTLVAIIFIGCQNTNEESADSDSKVPLTEKEKISYAIGVNMGHSISDIKDEIDMSMLYSGISDETQGKDLMVSNEEAQSLLQAFTQKLMVKQQEKNLEAAKNNLETGRIYLEENKIMEGVIVTESGLQYKVLKEGDGKSPGKTDRIMVHYKGTKLDGTVFDSSYERGEPATFQVDQVISGWTEGVQLMKEGGKYKLFIPANLAYGEGGAGQQIGPNEVLIFEVELLEIVYSQPTES